MNDQNPIFLKNGKNHPKRKNVQRYAKISDTPLDQSSLIHREAGFPPCFVRQNQQKNNFFLRGDFRPLPNKNVQILDHFFPLLFPQGFRIAKNIEHPTLGSGGKKTVKRYLKSEHTDTQTDRHQPGQKIQDCGLVGHSWWQMMCLYQENVLPKFQN